MPMEFTLFFAGLACIANALQVPNHWDIMDGAVLILVMMALVCLCDRVAGGLRA